MTDTRRAERELIRHDSPAEQPLVEPAPPEEARPEPPHGLVPAALDLGKRAVKGFVRDKSPTIAASLSYYAVVALAPLLILAVALLGLFLKRAATEALLVSQARTFAGPQIAAVVQGVIAASRNRAASGVSAIIGIGAAVLGAAGGFAQLQGALNTVWNVSKKRKRGIVGAIVSRLPSFLMLGVVVALLLVSAAASAVTGTLDFPLAGGSLPPWVLQVANFVISLGVLTLAFAAVYKVLPDTDVKWRDVWTGGAFTALLFTAGRAVLGLYLGHSAVASAYGAAGSLALLLVWVYYSAQVVLFGAEFTQVYACTYGSRKSGELCGVRPEGGPAADARQAPEEPQGRPGRAMRGGAHVT